MSSRARWLALTVALLGVAYGATLLTHVGAGDTAKFQYLGKVLGTPHATGYPLYLLLNGAFVRLLPVGSLALRADLLSALFAIGACCVLFLLLARLGAGPAPAAAAALTLGLSRTFWSQAVVAEVYTLHVLLTALVLLWLCRWLQERGRRDLLLAAYFCALSFGNHMLTAALLPWLLAAIFRAAGRALWRPRTIGLLLLLFAVAASQYGYLFVRERAPGAVLEMRAPDLRTFLDYLTGSHFRTWMFAEPAAVVLGRRVPSLALTLWQDLAWLAPLGVCGLALVRPRSFLLVLAGLAATVIVIAAGYAIPDIEAYLLPVVLVLAIGLGLTLEKIATRLRRTRRPWRAAEALLLLLPLVPLAGGPAPVDHGRERRIAAWVDSVLVAVGSPALVVGPDYARTQALLYALVGEGRGGPEVGALSALDHEALAGYVAGRRALAVPGWPDSLRARIPVYVMDPVQILELRRQGLAAIRRAGRIYEVTGEPEATAVAAADGAEVLPPLPRASVRYLRGWGEQEPWGRWALGEVARLAVDPKLLPGQLVVEAATWLSADQRQSVAVLLDGRPVGEFQVGGPPWQWQQFRLALPAAAAGTGRSLLELRFDRRWPDAGDPGLLRALPVQDVRVEPTGYDADAGGGRAEGR